MKKYPSWYIREVKNKSFYDSEEYRKLLDDAITEYNRALEEGDLEKIEKWKELILKWIINKETNRFMLMQVNN